MTLEEMREEIIRDDAEWLTQCAIKGQVGEIRNYVLTHVVAPMTDAAVEIEYHERWGQPEEIGG